MLALTLLVTRVSADHTHDSIAANDLAVSAHFSDRCPDFHERSPNIADESANRTTATVIAQIGFLHHAFVLMTHGVCLHLRHEVHCYYHENQQ